jgi:cellulose synthase/poly-beta-1,6-N-acetylglucosamine synthase-like glycosyltransferase
LPEVGLIWAYGPLYLIAILILFAYATRYYLFTSISVSFRKRQRRRIELDPNIDPFVSILLPTYNEANVVSRLLYACTHLDFPDYEVIVIDDSTDRTLAELQKWNGDPRVKIIHRKERAGWKGGALNEGLENLDPRSTHVLVFDADFVPPRDIISRFLAHFEKPEVEVVQGYQKHDLNSNENWITKGIRIFHSTAYKIDLEARGRLKGFVPIMGSVFMTRTQLLKEMRFEHDITEDYNLGLRLYLQGYNVSYDSSLAVSGECPSSLPRVFRQIGRWAEGTTRNSRQYFWKVMRSKKMSLVEKLDFVFSGFSYLSSLVLLIVTVIGVLNIPFLQVSMKDSNMFVAIVLSTIAMPAAVLAQCAALYKDGAISQLKTVGYSLLLSYILIPVVTYYALKGLFLKQKTFIRTFKTGRVIQLQAEEFGGQKEVIAPIPNAKSRAEFSSKYQAISWAGLRYLDSWSELRDIDLTMRRNAIR